MHQFLGDMNIKRTIPDESIPSTEKSEEVKIKTPDQSPSPTEPVSTSDEEDAETLALLRRDGAKLKMEKAAWHGHRILGPSLSITTQRTSKVSDRVRIVLRRQSDENVRLVAQRKDLNRRKIINAYEEHCRHGKDTLCSEMAQSRKAYDAFKQMAT